MFQGALHKTLGAYAGGCLILRPNGNADSRRVSRRSPYRTATLSGMSCPQKASLRRIDEKDGLCARGTHGTRSGTDNRAAFCALQPLWMGCCATCLRIGLIAAKGKIPGPSSMSLGT